MESAAAMERATAAHARKALKRSNTLRADAHAILSPTNVSFTRRLTPPGMADDGEVDSITRTSSTQLRWLQQAERQVASEDAAMKQHLDTTHDGVIDGHRADQSQHGEMHLPVRKVYRRLALEEKYRGAYIYLSLALVLTVRNWYRFDWQFASKTYQFLAQAIDEIDGVNAQDTPYCSRTPEGQWVDNATGLICNLYYPDLSEARDLRDYLTTNMLDLPVSLRSICSECAVAMTMSDLSPKMLNPNDYMCSDYDESRSDRAATGPVREGCRGDVVSQLPIDLAWIANPTSVSVPCCRNQTVIFASLYLTALAEGELVMGHGAGVAARPFSELSQYYDMMKAGATNQVIFDFLQRNVHQSGHFMQILISRNQRVFGMNFGAFWSDPGCYDPNYIGSLKSLVTAGKPLADYSAKATLDDCWADQLITPNLRFWSHRYDEEGVSIDGVLQLIYYVLLVFDMTHTAFAIYSTLPENIKRSAREKLVERLVTPRFILLEVASWVLPTLTDTQESMVQPSYALLVSVAQLFVFARAFAEAEAFEPVEKLVSAIGSAAGEIAGLVTIIVVSCVAFMFIYGQLFGIFHLAAARSGLWVYIHLFLEIFHVLIAGAEMHEELFEYNPWGVALVYVVCNLYLFLIMSQVFIAILCGAFDAAETRRASAQRDLSLPPCYVGADAPRRAVVTCCHFPIYLLTGYDITYGAFAPIVFHATARIIAEAEAADEAGAKGSQVMATADELTAALRASCCGEPRARQIAESLLAVNGAKKLDVHTRDQKVARVRQVSGDSMRGPHHEGAPDVTAMSTAEWQRSIEAKIDRLQALLEATLPQSSAV